MNGSEPATYTSSKLCRAGKLTYTCPPCCQASPSERQCLNIDQKNLLGLVSLRKHEHCVSVKGFRASPAVLARQRRKSTPRFRRSTGRGRAVVREVINRLPKKLMDVASTCRLTGLKTENKQVAGRGHKGNPQLSLVHDKFTSKNP